MQSKKQLNKIKVMKQSKQQDTNVKLFMQTEAYNQLNIKLKAEINNNSQAFNCKIPQPSNLLVFTPKSPMLSAERKALKNAKRDFKLMPDQGREAIIEALVGSPMPNWNIIFKPRRKNLS